MAHLTPRIWVPPHCVHLFQWFWDMSRSRENGMSGSQPLSLREMESWARVTGNIVRPHEWMILRAMEDAYLVAMAKESEERQHRQEARQRSASQEKYDA